MIFQVTLRLSDEQEDYGSSYECNTLEHLVDVGMLSGNGEAILDTWRCNVVGEEV